MRNREPNGKNNGGGPIPAPRRVIGRESGFALPIALAVLLIITFLGLSAITFTNLGVDVSRNVRNAEFVFYTADSCLVLARGVLAHTHSDVTKWNVDLAGHGITGDEILTASDVDTNTGVVKVVSPRTTPRKGVILRDIIGTNIINYPVGNGFCTVYVRNNREDLKAGSLNTDTDDIVVITAVGTSSTGATDTIEAAISWAALTTTGAEYPSIADYPQMTMGPQNLNAAKAHLDVLAP